MITQLSKTTEKLNSTVEGLQTQLSKMEQNQLIVDHKVSGLKNTQREEVAKMDTVKKTITKVRTEIQYHGRYHDSTRRANKRIIHQAQ